MRYALLTAAIALLLASAGQAAAEWRTEREPEFGFSFSYPQDLFAPVEAERPSFYFFESEDTGAKLMVGAWSNEEGRTPQEFKKWMLDNTEGYEDITYQPRGRSWFVVSGYRGDQVYYEKVVFSCRGKVANALAIAYPVAQRDLFDPVVERMEDSFKPGPSCG